MRGRRPRHGRARRGRAGPLSASPAPWWFGPDRLAPARPGSPWDIVFLDRDGTLNERVVDGYVTAPAGLRLLPGAAAAVARLTATGARTVLVTNQRGIARELMTRDDLLAVHEALLRPLRQAGADLDAIAVCPHGAGECACRKPAPGLFVEALARAPWARPGRCLMIGDMPSDLEPADGLGMRTVRVGPEHPFAAVVGDLLGP